METRTARFALLSSLGRNVRPRPASGRSGRSGRSAVAPEAPIALVRNGKEFHITGNQSTVRAGTEILVKTERPKVSLSLAEMDQGSWVIFELPGFTKAASGTEQASMDALRKANETSYFRGGDALWVKLVVTKAPYADCSSNGSASQYSGQQIGSVSRTERSPGHKSGGMRAFAKHSGLWGRRWISRSASCPV